MELISQKMELAVLLVMGLVVAVLAVAVLVVLLSWCRGRCRCRGRDAAKSAAYETENSELCIPSVTRSKYQDEEGYEIPEPPPYVYSTVNIPKPPPPFPGTLIRNESERLKTCTVKITPKDARLLVSESLLDLHDQDDNLLPTQPHVTLTLTVHP